MTDQTTFPNMAALAEAMAAALQPPAADARTLSRQDYRAARAAACAPQKPVYLPVAGGRLARDLSGEEYRAAIAQLKARR
jgi:hypothetical protein